MAHPASDADQADVRNGSEADFTLRLHVCLVPKADIRTTSVRQLLDHRIGTHKEQRRNGKAKRLGSLEVDNQLKPGG